MTQCNFGDDLAWSQSQSGKTIEGTIRKMLRGCVGVEKTDVETDKSGIDYYATLRRGARVGIDQKARRAGCGRFWTNGPELALEVWSVRPVPELNIGGVVGWTLDESKQTDYTLHTFDQSDTDQCYLLPFQLLRIAFREHKADWEQNFQVAIQHSDGWDSECIFVPAWCVIDAIREAMELLPDDQMVLFSG